MKHTQAELAVARPSGITDKFADQDAAILAPLALAAFGSILDIASGMDDFCLGDADILTVATSQWEYAKFPNSFKTSLQQLVLEGYTAFSKAEFSTKSINDTTLKIRDGLDQAVDLALCGSAEDLKTLVNEKIYLALEGVKSCSEAAAQFSKAFCTLPGLAQELAIACDLKIKHAERVKAYIIKNLRVELEEFEFKQNEAHQNVSYAKESLLVAIRKFEEANEAYSRSTVAFCSQSSSGYSFGHVTRRAITESDTHHTSISHHTLLEVVERFCLLLGGHGGPADWDEIRCREGEQKSTAHGIHEHLCEQIKFVKANRDQHAHDDLLETLESLAFAASEVVSIADGQIDECEYDAIVRRHRPVVLEAVRKIKAIIGRYNGGLLAHETGRIATKGFHSNYSSYSGRRETYESSSFSKAKVQMETAHSELEIARTTYEEVTRTVVSFQDEIIRIRLEIARVSTWNADLIALHPRLVELVIILRRLHTQFEEIGLFFKHNFSSLKDAVECYITQWVETLCSIQMVGFAGISTYDLTRQLIYQQLLFCLRLVRLAHGTANAYAAILTVLIIPASCEVDRLFKVHFSDVQLRKKILFLLSQCIDNVWELAPGIIEKNRESFFSMYKQAIYDYEYEHQFTACQWNFDKCDLVIFEYIIKEIKSRLVIESVISCDCEYEHCDSCKPGRPCEECHSKRQVACDVPTQSGLLEVTYDGFSPQSESSNAVGFHSQDISSSSFNETVTGEYTEEYQQSTQKEYSQNVEEYQQTLEEQTFQENGIAVEVS
ncbi:hypothetical protein BDN72DRAFT_895396 [Pluteus cervinus]|uniref:Uncharacterized protein n=1 Tax=Pluteus cervinus TaxID=181527 RepID=A0ACD3B142_9AGAR|nr:hypothetical protein BDN72DRAFT_895396 [Pluteus cervinus]